MTYASGTEAVNMDLKSSTTVSGAGLCLVNDSTNNTVDLSADGEICIGISADESSRDAAGDLETSGATVAMYPLGGVLLVQAEASQTFTTGLIVYVGASGQVIDSNDHTSKILGIYVGSGAASTTAGDLIPVMTAGAATS
jgi:hypothetical protein